MSATSRQPLSIERACPRPGILTISVTPGLRCWRVNEALEMAQGTASVQGLRLAAAAGNSGTPEVGTAKVS